MVTRYNPREDAASSLKKVSPDLKLKSREEILFDLGLRDTKDSQRITYRIPQRLETPATYKLPPAKKSGGFLGALGDLIGVIDTPRAAIVSTIKETGDLIRGDGFSASDWWTQTSDNMMMGEVLRDWGVDLPGPLDFVVGLGLDIALDPLTYLTAGTINARYANPAKVADALTAASRTAKVENRLSDAKMLAEAAGRVTAKKSIMSAGDDALRQIGMGVGVRMTMPGTGRIARSVIEKPLRFTSKRIGEALDAKRIKQLPEFNLPDGLKGSKSPWARNGDKSIDFGSDEIFKEFQAKMKLFRSNKFADLGDMGSQIRSAARMPVEMFKVPVGILPIPKGFIKVSAGAAGTAFGALAATRFGILMGETLGTKGAYNRGVRELGKRMAKGDDEAFAAFEILRFATGSADTANVKVGTWQHQTIEQLRDVRMATDSLEGIDFEKLVYQAADEPWTIIDQTGNSVFNPRLSALGFTNNADMKKAHTQAISFWKNAGERLEAALEPFGVKIDLQDFKDEFYVPRYLDEAEVEGYLIKRQDQVTANMSTGTSNSAGLSGQAFSKSRIYVAPATLKTLRSGPSATAAGRLGISVKNIDTITDEMIHNAAKANKLDEVAEKSSDWATARAEYKPGELDGIFNELADNPMGVVFQYPNGSKVSNRHLGMRLSDITEAGSIRKQMDEIGKAKLGSGYKEIYTTDPEAAIKRYINQASATLRQNMFMAALDNAGITVRLGPDKKKWFGYANELLASRMNGAVKDLNASLDPVMLKKIEAERILRNHARRIHDLDLALAKEPPANVGDLAKSRADYVKASEGIEEATRAMDEIQTFVSYFNDPNAVNMPSAYGMSRDVFELLRPPTNNPSAGQRIFEKSVAKRVEHLQNIDQAVNVTNDLAETINNLTQMRIGIVETLGKLDVGDLTKAEFQKLLNDFDDVLENGSNAVRELNLNYMDNLMENDVTVLFAKSYIDLADEVVRDTAYKITRNGRKLTQRTFRTPVHKELRNLVNRMKAAASKQTDPLKRAEIRSQIDVVEDWLNNVTEVRSLSTKLGEARLYSAAMKGLTNARQAVTRMEDLAGITEIRNQIDEIDELIRRSSGVDNLDAESQKIYDSLNIELRRLQQVNEANQVAIDDIMGTWESQLALAKQRFNNKSITVQEMQVQVDGINQQKEALLTAVQHEITVGKGSGTLSQRMAYLGDIAKNPDGSVDYAAATQREAIAQVREARAAASLSDAYGNALNDYVLAHTPVVPKGDPRNSYSFRSQQAFGDKSIVGSFTQGDVELMVDAMAALGKMQDFKEMGEFWKRYDKFLTWWKAQAVTSPGFFMRNQMGGMWINNQMNEVPMHTHARVREIRKIIVNADPSRNPLNGLDSLIAKGKPVKLKGPIRALGGSPTVSIDELKTFKSWFETGMAGQGQVTQEIGSLVDPLAGARQQVKTPWRRDAVGGAFAEGSYNPFDSKFKPMNWVRARNADSEFMLRGALAHHNMMVGGSVEEAWTAVTKYHFDYGDLTMGERRIKKVIPFWTWQKSVLPLLLESVGKNPKMWGRLQQVKGELELSSPSEHLVPHWFGENMGMRLPFTSGGNRVYVMPDLPFRDLNKITKEMGNPFDVKGLVEGSARLSLESALPPIKFPIELMLGSQVFGGIPFDGRYQQAPIYEKIPGLAEALVFTGLAKRAKNGRIAMTDQSIYAMDQMSPLLGRLRRLFPTEEKKQETAFTTWINTFFGAGIRANTSRMKNNEIMRRQREFAEQWQQNIDVEWRTE